MKTKPKNSRKITPAQARKLRLVTGEDVLKTCRVAAAIALKGEAFGEHDRMDTAAGLVLHVMEKAKEDHETVHPADGLEALYPARLIGMDFLVQRASDARRALLLRSERHGAELESADSTEDDAPKSRLTIHGAAAAPDADPLNDGTPWGARRAALSMLADAGLWDGSRAAHLTPLPGNVEPMAHPQGVLFPDERSPRVTRSTVRATAPDRDLFSVAYMVCRATGAGLEGPEVAAELDMSADALKSLVKRVSKRLRKTGHDPREWFPALNAEGLGWTAPQGTLRTDERASQRDFQEAPTTTRKIAKRSTDQGGEWTKRMRVPHPNRTRYVDPLTPLQRAAYERKTAMRRAAQSKLSDAERASNRRAAGLPSAPPK